MRILKETIKWFLYFLIIPFSYIIISLVLTLITVNKTENGPEDNKVVYLGTNGVHSYIVIPKNHMDIELSENLEFTEDEKYFSFGWGDENFYLNTPTWDDLTFGNAFQAMLLKSSALIHLTRYKHKRNSWVKVILSESELKKLNSYILASFKRDSNQKKMILPNRGYSTNDDFYKANGSFSCLKTCNSWANSAFKESGLKSCFWTPFDFGLINKYK